MDEEYTDLTGEASPAEERKAGPAVVIRNLLISLAAIAICFMIGLLGGKMLATKKAASSAAASSASSVTSMAADSTAASAASAASAAV